jgi:hypothetical protein
MSDLATEQRRAAQLAYRANGGSARRPLKSFMTPDEKRAARVEHAERLAAAVEHVSADLDGLADWLEALELCPHLSPLNCALVALQCPGEIVDTFAGWKRNGYPLPKGTTAAARLTGPGFWPKAAFTATQARADDLAALVPETRETPAQHVLDDLRARLAAGKARDALEGFAREHCGRETRYSGPLRRARKAAGS